MTPTRPRFLPAVIRRVPLDVLEARINEYLEGPTDEPFDLSSVPSAPSKGVAASLASAVRGVIPPGTIQDEQGAAEEEAERAQEAAEEDAGALAESLAGIPEVEALGPLLRRGKEAAVLEDGMEYRVTVAKHVFEGAVLLQFRMTNTIREQVLENVRVVVDLSGAEGLSEDFAVSLPSMPLEGAEPGSALVCLRKDPGALATGTVGCTMSFTLKEVDAVSGEVEVSLGCGKCAVWKVRCLESAVCGKCGVQPCATQLCRLALSESRSCTESYSRLGA